MEPRPGERWRKRHGGGSDAQIAIVVWVASGHVDLLVGSGGETLPLETFLANWVPVDEDSEITNRIG